MLTQKACSYITITTKRGLKVRRIPLLMRLTLCRLFLADHVSHVHLIPETSPNMALFLLFYFEVDPLVETIKKELQQTGLHMCFMLA